MKLLKLKVRKILDFYLKVHVYVRPANKCLKNVSDI